MDHLKERFDNDVLMLAGAKTNQTFYDEAMTITIDDLYTAFDAVEEKYFLASDCVDEWYQTENEINGFMAAAISTGLAYDAVYYEIRASSAAITLSEEFYFNYLQAYIFYMF